MSKQLTINQVKDIYRHTTQHGKTVAEAAHNMGIPYQTAVVARKNLQRYIGYVLNGIDKTKKGLRRNYLVAARWAIMEDKMEKTRTEVDEEPKKTSHGEEVVSVKVGEIPTAPQPTRYEKLNHAFAVFSDSLYAFIEAEVKAKTDPVIKENEAIKQLLDDAKVGNWAENLKKRLEGGV